MATTTNYSWTTPDDTDLVKDGAAAIRTLGSAIDTTVFNNASAAIAKSIVDAKGDLIAATAADTVARLAVGTNGYYLQADSSTSTGLKWTELSANAMTLLSTTTLSGAETIISSINQNYKNLFITIQNVTLDATGRIYFIPNGASNLTYVTTNNSASTTATSLAYQGNVGYLSFNPSTLNTGGNNSWSILINDYANTTSYKSFSFNGIYRDAGNTFDSGIIAGGGIEANDAISSINFTHNQTSFNAGTVKIYGVK